MFIGGVAVTIGLSFFLGGIGAIFGLVGVAFGLIVLLGAAMMYSKPQTHTTWGVIILILSLVAFPSLWGFGIGSLLAFIGGILALVFRPMMGSGAFSPTMGSPMPMGPGGSYQAYASQTPSMAPASVACKSCGANAPSGALRCPNCGASL